MGEDKVTEKKWAAHFTNKSCFLFLKEKSIPLLIGESPELPTALKMARGIALHFYYLLDVGKTFSC